jgi:hypothetical protein
MDISQHDRNKSHAMPFFDSKLPQGDPSRFSGLQKSKTGQLGNILGKSSNLGGSKQVDIFSQIDYTKVDEEHVSDLDGSRNGS